MVIKINHKQFKEPSPSEVERLKGELFTIKRSAVVDLLVKSLRKKADIEFNMEFLR